MLRIPKKKNLIVAIKQGECKSHNRWDGHRSCASNATVFDFSYVISGCCRGVCDRRRHTHRGRYWERFGGGLEYNLRVPSYSPAVTLSDRTMAQFRLSWSRMMSIQADISAFAKILWEYDQGRKHSRGCFETEKGKGVQFVMMWLKMYVHACLRIHDVDSSTEYFGP